MGYALQGDMGKRTVEITPRDIYILLMVYRYDRVTVDQFLRSGYFPSQVAAFKRLSALVRIGLLTTDLPEAMGVSWSKLLYGVGKQGRVVLAERLGLVPSELRHTSHILSPFLANHHLAICDF